MTDHMIYEATSVPREVNGKWYPVPMPEEVPISTSFATEAECAAFLHGLAVMHAAWRTFSEILMEAEEESHEEGYQKGYAAGKRDAKKDAKKTA